jgi:hypothetical protein
MMPIRERDRALTMVSAFEISQRTLLLIERSSMCNSPQCLTHLMAGLIPCGHTHRQMRSSICRPVPAAGEGLLLLLGSSDTISPPLSNESDALKDITLATLKDHHLHLAYKGA